MPFQAAGKTQRDAVLLYLRPIPNGAQHAQHPFKAHRRTSPQAVLRGRVHGPRIPLRSTPADLLLCLLSSLRKQATRGIWLPREGDAQEHRASVAGVSRACLLTSWSTEGGEDELCLALKLLVCPAPRELPACRRAGTPGERRCKRGRSMRHPMDSSPRGPGCKSLGQIWALAQGAGEVLVYNRLRTAVIHCS